MFDQEKLNQIGHTAHWYAKALVDQVQRFVVGLVLAAGGLVLSASIESSHGVAYAALCLLASWLSYGPSKYARWAGMACPWLCAASYACYIMEVL